ncbi:hypothetical protein [Geodermatophilus sp. SYSU D00700]
MALAVVHPVGQVRDVLRRALAERERPAVFATVDEAVADARPAAPPPAGPRP